MKSSTTDNVERMSHHVKGKIREVAVELTDNPKMEADGAGEKIAGRHTEKFSQVMIVLGK